MLAKVETSALLSEPAVPDWSKGVLPDLHILNICSTKGLCPNLNLPAVVYLPARRKRTFKLSYYTSLKSFVVRIL